MRVIFKILLFPVVLVLTVLVNVCRFLCHFSSMLLSIVAVLFFVLALSTMVLLHEVTDGIGILVLAYLISPFGIPLFASWLVEKLDDFNFMLKSI